MGEPKQICLDAEFMHRPADRWGRKRIWAAGAVGAIFSGYSNIRDFWPLGAGGSTVSVWRTFFDLSGVLFTPLILLVISALLVAAAIDLLRRHVRRMASGLLAILALIACGRIVATVPVFDPWMWYAVANESQFEAFAQSRSPPNEPLYAVLEETDVSTGIAGLNANHFITLIYDESDAVSLEPSDRPGIWRTRTFQPEHAGIPIPRGRKLYGHIFRVDQFI